jgi:hypothetical protein
MENRIAHYRNSRFFLGLVLLLIGSLYLLDNFGFIYVGHISRFWPALFILFGFVRLLEFDGTYHHGSGLGWIFLGSWLLISMNGMFGLDFNNSWPILIIGWGASMIWKASYRRPQITIAEEQHHGN